MSADLLPIPHPNRHRAMLARYGFGLFPVPTYRDAAVGEWRVVGYGPALVEGYLSGLVMEPRRHVLHQGRTAWMSTGLIEQESHAFHVHQARGVVVVAGLGMGMYAYAVSLKPEVERIVVVERAPEVIAGVREAAGLPFWPAREKVTILKADALGPEVPARVNAATGGQRPDYVYEDIWPICGAPEAPAGQRAWCGPCAPTPPAGGVRSCRSACGAGIGEGSQTSPRCAPMPAEPACRSRSLRAMPVFVMT